MKVIKQPSELHLYLDTVRNSGQIIGFVPTMGALHKGHLSLIEKSVSENNFTLVSIFVNPTQFNESSDFTAYPRNDEKDLRLLEKTGADAVFFPSVEGMYGSDKSLLNLDLEGLDTSMEGAFRPGHFKGVITVVDKFFSLAKPNKAYFGLKDYQQLAVITLMAEKLHPSIKIIPCPIEREESGLAMSSRNELLSEHQREEARAISKALFQLEEQWKKKDFRFLVPDALESLKSTSLSPEYLLIADSKTLVPLTSYTGRAAVACIAARSGKVRLIDNVLLPA